jgi:PE family protein
MDGYVFDWKSFAAVRQAWTTLAQNLANDREQAQKLTSVLAPGHEPASGFVATDQNTAGTSLVNSITSMQAFVDSYIAGLQQSRQEYLAQEDRASTTLRPEER